jgi:type IV secretion system protein TrbL
VLLAFFVLAIQLFITLIEFKLTTLAGFVLIPFGLFGKTAFMAEQVLGNVVISSGIKVLVLAVIVGIGSTLFASSRAGFGGATPEHRRRMAIVLAALSLLGLGIFGPASPTALSPAARSSAQAPPSEPARPAGGALAGRAAVRMPPRRGGGGRRAVGGAAPRWRAPRRRGDRAYSLGSAGQSGAAGVAPGWRRWRAAAGAAMSPLRRKAAE